MEIVLRHVKATRVGINLLEITICGAVPPYNAMLGGKLVAMLLTSPEVVQEYERRYRKSYSLIASSTAGRAVQRRPNSSRWALPASLASARQCITGSRSLPWRSAARPDETVQYEELGSSVGYGSIQFSPGHDQRDRGHSQIADRWAADQPHLR